MNNKEVFNQHTIQGENVKIFYPTNEQYQVIIEKLLLPSQKFDGLSMYFDLGQYQICEFLIPMITDLSIEEKKEKKALKREIIKTSPSIQPLIIDFQDILKIATGIFADNVNKYMETE